MLAWHFLRICFSEERLENSILIKLKSYLVIHRTSHPSSALVTCPLLVAFQVSPRPGCTIMTRKHYRLEIVRITNAVIVVIAVIAVIVVIVVIVVTPPWVHNNDMEALQVGDQR